MNRLRLSPERVALGFHPVPLRTLERVVIHGRLDLALEYLQPCDELLPTDGRVLGRGSPEVMSPAKVATERPDQVEERDRLFAAAGFLGDFLLPVGLRICLIAFF